MDWFRLKHTIGMHLQRSASKRAEYLKRHHILHSVGDNCAVMFRKIPLYSSLISLGNNVIIASNVLFVTHDMIHPVINRIKGENELDEFIGCISIQDNVFIGANVTILPNVSIGSNTIIGACSLVNKSISGGVYAGVPAKYVCSIEDFICKRRKLTSVEILKDKKGGLADSTIDKLWNKFRKMERMD